MPRHPTRFDPARTGNAYLAYYAPHKVYHPGIDYNWGYGDQDLGQDVWAPSDAIVEYVAIPGANGGLGQYVVLFHPAENLYTRYLHLLSVREGLKKGDRLAEGEVFSKLGKSGTVSAHLHFEVLNRAGYDWIRQWHRAFGRYPSGLSKAQVAAMFLDPETFVAGAYTKKLSDKAAERREARRARKAKRS